MNILSMTRIVNNRSHELGWNSGEQQTTNVPAYGWVYKIKSAVQTDMLICFYTLLVIATTSLATPLLSPTLPSAAHLIHTNNSAATDTPTPWHSEHDAAQKGERLATKSGIIELLSRCMCVQYVCTCVCSTAMSPCVNLRSLALLQMRPGTAGDRSSASLLSILPRCSLSFLFS